MPAIALALGLVCGSAPCHGAARGLEVNTSDQAKNKPKEKEQRPGRWHPFPTQRFQPALTPEQRKQIQQLRSIGYLQGSSPATVLSGVTRHDPTRAFAGVNFYTSGHGCEALLVDMDGNVLHRWARAFAYGPEPDLVEPRSPRSPGELS